MKIDNTGFNVEHYKGWKESDFIADQLASVPDSYGNLFNKKAFLKAAFAAIKAATKGDEKPVAKPEPVSSNDDE